MLSDNIYELTLSYTNPTPGQRLVFTGHGHNVGLGLMLAHSLLAMSSSPRPWIDVFALPKKFNMAVTESDLEHKVRKMFITF